MSGEAEDPRAARERALVRVLELTEELVALKLELGARMKQGCFDLAAARYSRPVSRTQYDMNMRATTRVVTRVSDDAPAGGTPRGEATPSRSGSAADTARDSGAPHRRFEVAASGSTTPRDAAERRDTSAVSGDGGGLRRRVATASATTPIGTNAREEEEEKKASRSDVVDGNDGRSPLAWFGAMPPPSLRRARSRFVECVELVAKIATVSSELRAWTSESSPATRDA